MSTASTPIQHTSLSLLAVAGMRRLTVPQYHKMLDAGIIMEGERVELLEGYLLEKPVRNPPHDGVVTRLTNRIPRRVPVGWVVRVQCAVTFAESEPEPDGAIVRGDDTTYDGRHPDRADFGIVIEVSDSSLDFDRREKGRIYAREGIPVYWIINVADRQVELYTDPQPGASPPAYATRTDYLPGQDVPVLLDGQATSSIPVADLLP
jgi:Uma2 family endonuclease